MKVTGEEVERGRLSEEALHMTQMRLKIQGYVVLEGLLQEATLRAIKLRFDELLEEFAKATDPNRGASRYGMPLPFEEPFATEELVANPVVLQILRSVLGENIVCSYLASDTPLPGSSYQHAHSDVDPLFPEKDIALPPFAYVVNVPLVDFRPDNGPLEIWPYGTHLIPDTDLTPIADFTHIEERLASPLGRMAEEMGGEQLLASAGSVVIRDLRMWHRGTPNRSDSPRPMIAMVFNRSWYHHGTVEINTADFEALPDEVRTLFRTAVLR